MYRGYTISFFAGQAVDENDYWFRTLTSAKDFEAAFREKFTDPEREKAFAAKLAEAEKEINAENKAFASGKAHFSEKLNEWSNVPTDEFEKEREGGRPAEKGGAREGKCVN